MKDAILLRKICGAMKDAKNAHPEIDYAGFETSIAKRIAHGAVNEELRQRVERLSDALRLLRLTLDTAWDELDDARMTHLSGQPAKRKCGSGGRCTLARTAMR